MVQHFKMGLDYLRPTQNYYHPDTMVQTSLHKPSFKLQRQAHLHSRNRTTVLKEEAVTRFDGT
jgi:hypothetical protein